jgi:nicotinate phosphoribosyltransferase
VNDPRQSGRNPVLITDLYELTMLQSYFDSGMNGLAVFDLFVRRLPGERNYLIACGLDDVLAYLENLRFDKDSIDYLRSLQQFSESFLESLLSFRFTGDVYAVPEGAVVFGNEPILEVAAPLPQAQLIETYAMNQIHLPTLAASKASRVVSAAQGKTVVDFGLRRMQGADTGLKAARAFYIAGIDATSNVLAGKLYGIPVAGTMAHSFVQAHDSELESFRNFVRTFPETTLLVDTYDTLDGVRNVVKLARELGSAFRVRAIRLDSGNLEVLSKGARRILDEAGLRQVGIFASSGLDEYAIRRLLLAGAPITGFGVGSRMGVSADVPCLDTAYKLVEYAGRPTLKSSPGKVSLPGRKQILRQSGKDVIALQDEQEPGEPLLRKVMAAGRRLEPPAQLHQARLYRAAQLQALPSRLLELDPVEPYPVELSPKLRALQERLLRQAE